MKTFVLALFALLVVHLVVHRKPPVPKPAPVYTGYSGGRWAQDCVSEGLDARWLQHRRPNRGHKHG